MPEDTSYKLNNVDLGTCLITREEFDKVYNATKLSYKRNVLWMWGYLPNDIDRDGSSGVHMEPRMVTACVLCGVVPAPWKDFHLMWNPTHGPSNRVLDQQGKMYFWGAASGMITSGANSATMFGFTSPGIANSTYQWELCSNVNVPIAISKLGKDNDVCRASILIPTDTGTGLTARVWGCGSNGQLGQSCTLNEWRPVLQSFNAGTSIYNYVSMNEFSCNVCMYSGHAVRGDIGSFYYWGNNNTTRRSIAVNGSINGLTNNAVDMCASGDTVGVTLTEGPNLLMMSGYNTFGQLGDSTTLNKFYTANNWVCTNPPLCVRSFSVGRCSTFAVASNGTMWAWGDNTFGQLGNNRTVGTSCPVQNIDKNNNWRYVTTNRFGTAVAALKNDGSLWVWGNVCFLHNNPSLACVVRSSPVQVGTKKNWVKVGIENSSSSLTYMVGITEEEL